MKKAALLIHGIDDNHRIFKKMIKKLELAGIKVFAIDLIPNNGDVQIEEMAAQVSNYVNLNIDKDFELIVVGFSMGGIVARYYVQKLVSERVRLLVLLSAPNHGTILTKFLKKPAVLQMARNSSFLKELNEDLSNHKKLKILSIWTPFDLMILPASSSVLIGAVNVKVPVALHPLIPKSSKVIALVKKFILEH